MSVIIESAVIHILDNTIAMPVLADVETPIDEEISEYLQRVIEKTFYGDDIKVCKFRSESTVWGQCKDLSWELLPISKSIAQGIFTIMHRNKEVPNGDLLCAIVRIDNNSFFCVLKLEYRSAYTRLVEKKSTGIGVNVICNGVLFPSATGKISEAFFINMEQPEVRVVETKYLVDGIKDYYLSTQILNCTCDLSTRQKTTKLIQVAEKVANLYYSDEDDVGTHISTVMYEELKNGRPLSVERLGEKFFKRNTAAQEEFFERLSEKDIARDEELTLSERLQKKFAKTAIRSMSGVEIKIPTQVYTNSEEIEFINNPDGTVSILIKNIKI